MENLFLLTKNWRFFFFFFVLPLAVTAGKSGDDKALPHSSCISWSSVSKLQQSSSGLRATNGTAQILGASHLECNCKTLVGLERFFKIFTCWDLGSFSCTELFFCTFSVFKKKRNYLKNSLKFYSNFFSLQFLVIKFLLIPFKIKPGFIFLLIPSHKKKKFKLINRNHYKDQRLFQQETSGTGGRNSQDSILIPGVFPGIFPTFPGCFTSLSCSCKPLILSSSILCSSCTSLIRPFKSWFSSSKSLQVKYGIKKKNKLHWTNRFSSCWGLQALPGILKAAVTWQWDGKINAA